MELSLVRVPVRVRAQDGKDGGEGEIAYARPGLGRRLGKAAVLFLIGLVVGVLLLPIPLIHLFGVMFFLAMSGLAVRRLLSGTVLKGASGRCPSCQAEGPYFVGFGGRRLGFPVVTSCPTCNVRLELEPAPHCAGATAAAR